MKLKYQAALLTAALSLGACSSDDLIVGGESSATGSVAKPGVEVNNVEKVVKAPASRATYDVSNYIVDFYAAGQDVPYVSYKYSEMPGTVELPVGDYTARVRSHNVEKAAWDAPYFAGTSAPFAIAAGEITEVQPVKCVFSSLKVTVVFGPKLRAQLGDDVKVTVVANDEGMLEFTPDEERSGYFAALEGSSTIIVEFNGTVNGTYETLRLPITDAEAGQHRIITYTVPPIPGPNPDDPTGGINPGTGIGVDVSVVDEDLNSTINNDEDIIPDDDRPGGEDPVTPPGPGPVDPDDPKPANTIEIVPQDPLTFDKDNLLSDIDGKDLIVDVKAPKGIEHFLVKISSDNGDFIASAGEMLPLTFDLCYPVIDGKDWTVELQGLGFKTGADVIGSTNQQFVITTLAPLLAAFPGRHTFEIKVEDGDHQQSIKSLVIVVK